MGFNSKAKAFTLFLIILMVFAFATQSLTGWGFVSAYASDISAAPETIDGILAPPEQRDDIGLEPFSTGGQAFIDEVVRLVNAERSRAKIPLLAGWYPALNDAAAIRAGEITSNFSHTRPNGKDCFSVLDEKGIAYRSAGENIAAGYTTPAAVMSGWMNSPGHRANILNGDFNYMGVGYIYKNDNSYRYYWVQMFITVPTTPSVDISLSKNSLKIQAGKTASLTASMKPSQSTDNVIWSTDNPEVATVSSSGAFGATGVVKGVSGGTAAITASTRDGVAATITVTVTTTPYSILSIQGVIPPVRGKAPVTAITATTQYTGTVSWSPDVINGVFDGDTQYEAIITLSPKPGYGPSDIPADFFRVVGATSVTNAADSGVISAVFPKTAAPDAPVTISSVPLAAPVPGEVPETGIATEQYAGIISWDPQVNGVFAGKTDYTATITLTPKPGFTLVGVPAGAFTVDGADTVVYEADSDVISAVFPQTGFAPASLLSLSPSNAILAHEGDSVLFTAALAPEGADYSRVEWGFSSSADEYFAFSGEGAAATLKLAAAVYAAETVTVTATYRDGDTVYATAATVELLPAGEVNRLTTVRILDTKATVNKAKTVGARVPILITEQQLSGFGAQAFGIQAFSPAAAGSLVIDDVALYIQDKKSRKWTVPLTTFEARMCKTDDRYIEIDALTGAKNTGSIRVKLLPAGKEASEPEDWIDAEGTISLTVVDKYPKVAFKAGELNLVFRDRPASFAAVSANGACEVLGINTVKPSDEGKIVFDGGKLKIGATSKAASIAVRVNVGIPGYKPMPEKNRPRLNLKIVNTMPKLKLSKGIVTLAGAEDVPLSLLATDKKQTPESWGRIEKVTLDGGSADLYRHGMIYIPGETKAGGHKLHVYITGANKAVDLKLTVKVLKLEKVTISSKTKSIVVHKDHQAGNNIVTVNIVPNVSNVTINDLMVTGCPPGIGYISGPNRITFRVTDTITTTQKPITLVINSPSMQFRKPVKISMSITQSKPKCTVSLKGSIDVANPKSGIIGTVKLTNTTSAISDITLTGDGSDGFTTEISGVNTFTIKGREGTLPGVKRALGINVSLQNGDVLSVAKPVSIKPKQTVGKAYRSVKEITMYGATPAAGQAVRLGLTTPANVKLGEVRINEASVASMKFNNDLPNNGFELIQSGGDEWTVYFKDRKAPAAAGIKPLKSGYTLKIELWAEGTYEKKYDGSFEGCLRDSKGNPRSKPTLVSVRIKIRQA